MRRVNAEGPETGTNASVARKKSMSVSPEFGLRSDDKVRVLSEVGLLTIWRPLNLKGRQELDPRSSPWQFGK